MGNLECLWGVLSNMWWWTANTKQTCSCPTQLWRIKLLWAVQSITILQLPVLSSRLCLGFMERLWGVLSNMRWWTPNTKQVCCCSTQLWRIKLLWAVQSITILQFPVLSSQLYLGVMERLQRVFSNMW